MKVFLEEELTYTNVRRLSPEQEDSLRECIRRCFGKDPADLTPAEINKLVRYDP